MDYMVSKTNPQCKAETGYVWLYGSLDDHYPAELREIKSADECCAFCDQIKECAKWSFGVWGIRGCRINKKEAYKSGYRRDLIISGYGHHESNEEL